MDSAAGLRLSVFLLPAVLLTAGCSSSFESSPSLGNTPVSLSGMRGSVYGGQQPIAGAHVYVYAAGTSAYGGASQSLLTAFSTGSYPTASDGTNYYVTSDSGGNFGLTGEYTCSAGQEVYLYATGGNSGGGGKNAAIGLLAVLGKCPSTGTSPFASTIYVTVNEISTIATAYALSGFAVDATHVSDDEAAVSNPTAAQAQAGMANAFANAFNLTTQSTAAALATTPAGNGAVPQKTINTLGNILAACVNTTSPSSGGCTTLFAAATADGTAGGTKPLETATAAINIAHHPGTAANVALFGQQGTTPPFSPALPVTPAPSDFTLGINYTGGGIDTPLGIGIDTLGNAWLANAQSSPSSPYGGAGSVTGISASGAFITGTYGFSAINSTISPAAVAPFVSPAGVAIDRFNAVWVTDVEANSLTKIDSFLSPLGIVPVMNPGRDGNPNGLDSPGGVAVDGNDIVFVADNVSAPGVNNTNGGMTTIFPTGYPYGSFSPFITDVYAPVDVAVDPSNHVWFTNEGNTMGGGTSVVELNTTPLPNNPQTVIGVPYTGSLGLAYGIAFDSAGDAWVSDLTGNTVTKLTSISTAAGTFSSGGISSPQGVAVDGSGNVWIANAASVSTLNGGNGSLTELSNAGVAISPTGYVGGGLSTPINVAIDGSGNAWVTNEGANSVTELIGVATPVSTSLAFAINAGKLGMRP